MRQPSALKCKSANTCILPRLPLGPPVVPKPRALSRSCGLGTGPAQPFSPIFGVRQSFWKRAWPGLANHWLAPQRQRWRPQRHRAWLWRTCPTL